MPFQTAISGLKAAQTNLSVTANNIANVNTQGFKKSRASFVELFASGQRGGSGTLGIAARVDSIRQEFSQGALVYSGSSLDLALVGGGFFTLKGAEGELSYTRAGNFGVDRDGFLVNQQGLRVQAYAPQGNNGGFGNALTDLRLQSGLFPANPTTSILANLNLPANTATGQSQSISVQVFDALGNPQEAVVEFEKTANVNEWQATLTIEGVAIGNAETLSFDATGQLLAPAGGSLAFGAFTLDLTGSTQFGGGFSVNSLSQDGFSSGRLTGIDVDNLGVISARFTNGQSRPLGQLAITNFANPEGLDNVGDTRWAQTRASGEAQRGAAGSSGFGVVSSGALEAANIDLAEELVNMITAQRAYQANAQVLSTADNITQTILNIR